MRDDNVSIQQTLAASLQALSGSIDRYLSETEPAHFEGADVEQPSQP